MAELQTMIGIRNHKRGKVIVNIIKVKRSFSILVAELQTVTRGKAIANIIKVQEFLYPCGRLQTMTGNRNHKRGKVIANIIKVRIISFLCLAILQTMTGNRNHKRGKVIANIIKVKEFLYPYGRVADYD
jgi:hypothetical protein